MGAKTLWELRTSLEVPKLINLIVCRLPIIGAGAIYLLLVTVIIYLAFSDRFYDDPFITYRYADSLRRGLGFVYNPGERVLSTTTPLFAILLALLANLWHDLPHLANLIGAFSLALGGLFLSDLADAWDSPPIRWAALLLYPFFPLLLVTLGSETPLYLALCLGAFAFYARRQYTWTAVFTALAVLTRPDGLLVGIVLTLDYLLRRRGPIPWSTVLISLGLVLPWFIFAWLYFGSPLPATLATKQHQGAMAISTGFAPGLFTIMQSYAGWQYEIERVLAVLGLVAIRSAKQWLPFLLWPALYFVAYSLLGVSQYFWYYAPLVPGFLVLVGLGISALSQAVSLTADRLGQALRSSKFVLPVLYPIILFSLGIFQVRDMWQSSANLDPRVEIYSAIGKWIQANVAPNATIGTLEVGIIGYYAQRPMIDFAGLIQPEVARYLSYNTTYDDAALWAVERFKPDYLVLQEGTLPRLEREYSPQYCLPTRTFGGEQYGYPGNIQVYRCQWNP